MCQLFTVYSISSMCMHLQAARADRICSSVGNSKLTQKVIFSFSSLRWWSELCANMLFSRLKQCKLVTQSPKYTRLKKSRTSFHLCTRLPNPFKGLVKGYLHHSSLATTEQSASLISRLASHWQHRQAHLWVFSTIGNTRSGEILNF